MISVYGNLTDNNLTSRDQEAIDKYVKLIQWGRSHPVQFIEAVLQIPLMDYQKWLISNTWSKEFVAWVCSRNAGKSFLMAVIIQARAILYPQSKINIIGGIGRISSESFGTMENIIKNNVKSLVRNNTVILDEIDSAKTNSDGFSHDQKKGDTVTFLNGSNILSVIGAAKNVVGKRSNFLAFDESGIIPKELFDLVEPFATQSSEFKTGEGYDPSIAPKEIPNLRLYVGSATDTNSTFYQKYREYSKRMMLGDENYFVADLNCEAPLHPTMNGKKITPLLTQDVIDAKMRENPISAYREYYNIFDRFDSEDSVLSRSDVIKYTEQYLPIQWGGRKHKYIITYDPASRTDNAPVLITEVIEREGRIKGKFIHMENLTKSYGDGVKGPMTIEEQVKRIWELVWYYNGGDRVPLYENVNLYIDFGSGGQAPSICQELCKDWTDSDGKTHPGIYDDEIGDMRRWAEAYPHAISGCLHMLEPSKWRTQMFESLRTLAPMGDLIFAPDVPKSGILNIYNENTKEEQPRKLSKKEEESLLQMHLMVEEACLVVRSRNKTSGRISYGLPPEHARKVHDDRCYTLVMAALIIKQLQETDILGEPKPMDYSGLINGKELRKSESINKNSIKNEEGGKGSSGNPWLKTIPSNGNRKVSPFRGKSPFSR